MPERLTVTRRLTFEAGHRVPKHESKCRSLHGHSYKVEVTATADHLDDVGRVIDFGVLKGLLGTWIDDNWDHAMILAANDQAGILAVVAFTDKGEDPTKVYWLEGPPTAEVMARHLLVEICPTLFVGTGVTITKVVVHETENCYAEASL